MPDERPATRPPPAARVTPGTTADVRDVVRQSVVDAAPLRIAGRGTWPGGGASVSASRVLDLSRLTGIVEYVPGDLTLTARAGTTLAEIAEATRAHGQWLPLDPFGRPEGTLGATLATASAGPLGGSIGRPRDVAVGLSFISGDGALVQGGGRVVKNVAGFDLVRLTIGAWGTLGVIVEATVRLRARPEADASIAMVLPAERDALAAVLSQVRAAPVEALAAELVSPTLAARLGLPRAATLLVRVAGNPVAVTHQVTTLRAIAPCTDVDGAIWATLQASDPDDAPVLRISRRPSELARLWSTATSAAGVDAHASLARGIVRIRLADHGQAAVLRALDPADTRLLERVPPGWEAAVGPWRTPSDSISRRLRLAFDPHRLLNPGILGAEAT